jgi:hypothetical protein
MAIMMHQRTAVHSMAILRSRDMSSQLDRDITPGYSCLLTRKPANHMHDKYPTAEGVDLRILIRIAALSRELPSSHAWAKEPVSYMVAVTEEVSAKMQFKPLELV